MTIFVVSLFLPHTVTFDLPSKEPTSNPPPPRRGSIAKRPPPPARIQTQAEAAKQPAPSLFGTKEYTPPASADKDKVDHEKFFAQAAANMQAHQPKKLDPRSIVAPSDPHAPEWGSGNSLVQPMSRASSPPPSSILEHNKKLAAKAAALKKAGVTQPKRLDRTESHDRVFAEAKWQVVPADQGNGGLRNAVQAAARAGDKEFTWVGTLGMPTDALENTQQKQDIDDVMATEYDCMTVFVKDSDFDGAYTHYCKQILWPVFHYLIPDNPKSKAYEDHSWVYYVKVNQAFADKIVKNWKRGDVIWIHDYHLLLVPAMIRKKIPEAKIGFFLHVAFPSSEVFRCLAVRTELLQGMLGANLIGFQVQEYSRHFLQTCNRLLTIEATNDGVQLEDRFVNVTNMAIGIDPVALDHHREDNEVAEWLRVMQERYRGKKLIVARDKLDHVRGVRPKLLAYELFLNKHPEWRDKVVLIQVATSTTEQAELDATVSDIVTRVNSSWATLAYQPLVYLKQDISYAQYLALLTVADALMISSQREGMNLTSHEYLFCQDGKFPGHNRHGSLILSEFTGSASVFGGYDLSVNPWDYRACSDAIYKALEMKDDEKKHRWENLYKAVMHHTADHWFNTFIKKLDTVYEEQHRHGNVAVPRLSIPSLSAQYIAAQKRLFILDYEGTLAVWGSPNNIILTSPQRTISTLNDLLSDPRNIVYVMSGRKPDELETLFKRVPNLGLIAENGAYLREFGSSSWNEMADPEAMTAWKNSVLTIMNYYKDRVPGSWVEQRHCSLIFHYRNAEDFQAAERMAGDCAGHINDACEDQNVRAVPVDGAVVVESTVWTKAKAADIVMGEMKKVKLAAEGDGGCPIDFLLVVGDGREDEVCFKWANELETKEGVKYVTTVSLGSRNTEAKKTLTQGVTGVLNALQRLAACS